MARKPRRSLIALSLPGAGVGESVPTEFRIFSMGINPSEKGDFLFDDQAAASVMERYRQHDKPMLLDYNHATTYAQPTPEQAIAAGEFTPEVRADGLWATNVKWTDRARAALEAREYRLFSPYFEHDPKTGRVLRLINVALTNLPALDGIEPLMAASATASTGDDQMEEELKKLQTQIAALTAQVNERDTRIKALEGQTATVTLSAVVGLAATSNDAEVRTAVSGLVAFRRGVLETLGQANESAALGALTALKTQAAEVEGLKTQLREQERVALNAEWSGHLDELSVKGKDGKFLPPAKRPEVEKMALRFGGGTLTRAAVDFGKELALGMLDARTGASHQEIANGMGIVPGQASVVATMGIDPAKFAEFQKRQATGLSSGVRGF